MVLGPAIYAATVYPEIVVCCVQEIRCEMPVLFLIRQMSKKELVHIFAHGTTNILLADTLHK
jgi:hypothetical protein